MQIEVAVVLRPLRGVLIASRQAHAVGGQHGRWRRSGKGWRAPAGVGGEGWARLLQGGDRVAQIGDAALQIRPPRDEIVEADSDRGEGRGVGLHRCGELVEVGLRRRIHGFDEITTVADPSSFDEMSQIERSGGGFLATDTRC